MKMRSLLVIVLGFVLNGQGAWADPNVTGVEDSLYLAVEPQAKEGGVDAFFAWLRNGHFPPNALGPEGSQGAYIAQVFSYFLSGVDEPMLYNKQMAKDEVIIRLTLMPMGDGEVVFRAESNGINNRLIFKLSRTKRLGPYELLTREITLDRVAFQQIVERALETRVCSGAYNGSLEHDESLWVIEVKTAQIYCADSGSLAESGPRHDLAQEFSQHLEADDAALLTKWEGHCTRDGIVIACR